MPKGSVFNAKDETLLNILPHYWEIQSVLNLGQTSKKYHALANDTQLWQQLLRRDLQGGPSFLLDPTTRPFSPYAIYKALHTSRPILIPSREFSNDTGSEVDGSSSKTMTVSGVTFDVPKDDPDGAKDAANKSLTPPSEGPSVLEDSAELRQSSSHPVREFLARIDAATNFGVVTTASGDLFVLRVIRKEGRRACMRTNWDTTTTNQDFPHGPWAYRVNLPFRPTQVESSMGDILGLLDDDHGLWSYNCPTKDFLSDNDPHVKSQPTLVYRGEGEERIIQIAAAYQTVDCLMDTGDIMRCFVDDDPKEQLANENSSMAAHQEDHGTRLVTPIPPQDTEAVAGTQGETKVQSSPPLSPATDRVVAIASCGALTLALRENGEVWGQRRFYGDHTGDEQADWDFIPDISSAGVTKLGVMHIERSFVFDKADSALVAISGSPNGPIRSTMIDLELDGDSDDPTSGEPFKPCTIMMDLGGRTMVDICTDASNVFVLLITGEVYTWPCQRQGESNVQCSLDRYARKLILDGDDTLFVYSMSASTEGLYVMAMTRPIQDDSVTEEDK